MKLVAFFAAKPAELSVSRTKREASFAFEEFMSLELLLKVSLLTESFSLGGKVVEDDMAPSLGRSIDKPQE